MSFKRPRTWGSLTDASGTLGGGSTHVASPLRLDIVFTKCKPEPSKPALGLDKALRCMRSIGQLLTSSWTAEL